MAVAERERVYPSQGKTAGPVIEARRSQHRRRFVTEPGDFCMTGYRSNGEMATCRVRI
jgi:hypothetical protein